MPQIGKLLIVTGIVMIGLGSLIWLLGGNLQWFGNLPGDIKIVNDKFRLYIPITSMLLVSIFLSLVLWLVRKIG